MDAKLTLKLDKKVIEKAKAYAKSRKRSLSRLIESYLKTLVDDDTAQKVGEEEISPYVRSMRTGVKLPQDLDYKKERGDYLSKKHE